jgi:hypothetical protein
MLYAGAWRNEEIMNNTQYVTDERPRIAQIIPLEAPASLEAIKALLASLSPQDIEEIYDAVLLIVAGQAVEELRADARRRGQDRLSMTEIDAEIAAARAERRRAQPR